MTSYALGCVLACVLALLVWTLHRRESGGKAIGTALVALTIWFATLTTLGLLRPVEASNEVVYRWLTALMLSSVSVVAGSFLVLTLGVGARASASAAQTRLIMLVTAVEIVAVMAFSSPWRATGALEAINSGDLISDLVFGLHAAFCFLLAIAGLLVLTTRWDAFDTVTRRHCALLVLLVVAIIINEMGQYRITPHLVLIGLGAAYVAHFRLDWVRQVQLGRTLVADQLADPMIVVDNDGRIVDANHQARRLNDKVRTKHSIVEVLGDGFRLDDQQDTLVSVSGAGAYTEFIARSTRVVRDRDLVGWAVTLRDIDSLVYRQNDPVGDYRMLRRRRTDRPTGNENLAVLMRHDPLTAASTRIAFESVLEAAVASCRTGGQRLQVMMIDVDRFKGINDQHGHLAGDAILREVVDRVANFIRDGEMIARFGGDEFVLLLRRQSDRDALEVAQKMCRSVMSTPIGDEPAHAVTVSIGVAGFTNDQQDTGARLLASADQAMYRVKRAGGNGAGFGDDVVSVN